MENEELIVDEREEGLRLDKFLVSRFPETSRTYFQSLIDKGLVLVNEAIVKKRWVVKKGDEIEIEFALTPEISLEPENIPLKILYEDEALLAIDKPAGMVVHPGAGHFSHTFVNALLYHCRSLPGSSLRPGIVHRLDKETTGVLLAAKNEQAHQKMVAMFAHREIKKHYIAICLGNPGHRVIEGKMGRHPKKRKEMALLEEGKSSKTYVETVHFEGNLSVVHLFPETGRTHQLRVHLQSIATPILGDPLYGNESANKKYKITRQLLHAFTLTFNHPFTQKELTIRAPIPDDMKPFLQNTQIDFKWFL